MKNKGSHKKRPKDQGMDNRTTSKLNQTSEIDKNKSKLCVDEMESINEQMHLCHAMKYQ